MKKKKLPDLAALSDGGLADLWGETKAKLDRAEDDIEAFKAEFERRKLDFAKGDAWKIFKIVQNQKHLDTTAIRAAQGPKWCARFETPQVRISYPVKPVLDAIGEAKA